MTDPERPTTVVMLTPPGRGGIAVLTLRGPDTKELLAQAFRPVSSTADPAANGTLQLGHIVAGDRVIDQAIVARCEGGAEINIHGGPAAATAVLHRLTELGTAVLPQNDAPADNLPAAHPAWNNPAIGEEMLRILPGAASQRVAAAITSQWSAGLSELAASVLATCRDAAEEPAPSAISRSAVMLRQAAARRDVLRRLLNPPEVVLAGPPNAGKSTLANAMIGRAASIVHDHAGTTRDWVRELALLSGLPVWLTDTAGLWRTADTLDAEAVRRSVRRIASADLVLLLGAGHIEPLPDWLDGQAANGTSELDADHAATPPVLRVATKIDLTAPPADADAAVSAPTGDGLDHLARRIVESLGLADFDPSRPATFTDRQQTLLGRAADALETSHLSHAREALSELLGQA